MDEAEISSDVMEKEIGVILLKPTFGKSLSVGLPFGTKV